MPSYIATLKETLVKLLCDKEVGPHLLSMFLNLAKPANGWAMTTSKADKTFLLSSISLIGVVHFAALLQMKNKASCMIMQQEIHRDLKATGLELALVLSADGLNLRTLFQASPRAEIKAVETPCYVFDVGNPRAGSSKRLPPGETLGQGRVFFNLVCRDRFYLQQLRHLQRNDGAWLGTGNTDDQSSLTFDSIFTREQLERLVAIHAPLRAA